MGSVSGTEGRGNVMKKTRPVSAFYDVISVMNNLAAVRDSVEPFRPTISCEIQKHNTHEHEVKI